MTRPQLCVIEDSSGGRVVDAHDRGFRADATIAEGPRREPMLLRAEYPYEEQGRTDVCGCS